MDQTVPDFSDGVIDSVQYFNQKSFQVVDLDWSSQIGFDRGSVQFVISYSAALIGRSRPTWIIMVIVRQMFYILKYQPSYLRCTQCPIYQIGMGRQLYPELNNVYIYNFPRFEPCFAHTNNIVMVSHWLRVGAKVKRAPCPGCCPQVQTWNSFH